MFRVRTFFFLIGFLCYLLFLPSLANADSPLYLSFSQRLKIILEMQLATGSIQEKQQAESWISALIDQQKKPPVEVKVRSFDEFLNSWRGPWPESYSVGVDLEILESRKVSLNRNFVADDVQLQHRIDHYIQSQPTRLVRAMANGSSQISDIFNKNDLTGSMNDLVGLQDLGNSLLQVVSENIGKRVAAFVDQAISSYDPKDQAMKLILKEVLAIYYFELGTDSKKLIASAILGGNLEGNPFDFIEILLQNSGPQLQKLIQSISSSFAEKGMSAEVARVFEKIEDKVKVVPPELVAKEVAKSTKDFDIVSLDVNPLGVGTMAQVHAAKLRYNDGVHDVVVRFIKPGVPNRVEEDDRILSQAALKLDANPLFRATGLPRLSPLIGQLTQTVREELNIDATILRQQEAVAVYEKEFSFRTGQGPLKIQFHVPEVYMAQGPSNLHIQEAVAGQKLGVVLEGRPDRKEIRKYLAESLAGLWLSESLFGQGFYHADLHQGNLLVEMSKRVLSIHILDYGMGGRISNSQRDGFLLLAFASLLNSEKKIASILWSISDQDRNSTDLATLQESIRREIDHARTRKDPKKDVRGWLVFASDHGLALPYDLVNMNRGMTILENTLIAGGSTKSIEDISLQLALRRPFQVLKILGQSGQFRVSEVISLGFADWRTSRALRLNQKSIEPVRCEQLFQPAVGLGH